MRQHFNNFVARAIDWVFRKRSTGLRLIRIGASLLLALLAGGYTINFFSSAASGQSQFSLDMNQGAPEYLSRVCLGLAIAMIFGGLVLLCIEELRLSKKRAIVVELRGLRLTSGDPLKDKIPDNILGHRDQILIDLIRSDDRILDPATALQEITSLPTSIKQFTAGHDRSDVSLVAGGLAPVPFCFLMGVLLDDEGGVTVMDWDRAGNYWRSLDGQDDGIRFEVSGVDQVGAAEEIVMSVSVSYPANLQAIRTVFQGQPIVSMTLPNFATDKHWSETKQTALAQQFFDVVRTLSGTAVRRVNLVLAAPSSVAIGFGRIYDKRNLPPITVWQYENGLTPRYPWGVSMPVAGNQAEIFMR